jgi:hypothetical protein
MHVTVLLLLLSFLASCGKSNSNAGLPIQKTKIIPLNESNTQSQYTAKFGTLNEGTNGILPGSATIERNGDKIVAYVRLFGGAPNAWHQQNIYQGSRCPTMDDDLNADGYIDIDEGNKVWGDVLIPLDTNLNSRAAGTNIYPTANASGTYHYEKAASFNSLLNDLQLPADQGLDFEGRVVVVQGTASSISYPDTVATTDDHVQHQTLPIACGILSVNTPIPEEPREIPAPAPEPRPVPTTPAPAETPSTPTPATESRDDSDSDGDHWYDRLNDWWRTHH